MVRAARKHISQKQSMMCSEERKQSEDAHVCCIVHQVLRREMAMKG